MMTMLMVAALLPVTASAEFCAIILLETKAQHTVAELEELLPEIEMSSCHHLGGGTLFEIYFDADSDEDAVAAADMLNANPIVKKAEYCKVSYPDYDPSQASFEIEFVEGFFADYQSEVNLGKIFPEIEITNAELGGYGYRIEFPAETLEAVDKVYEILSSSPFVSEVYLCEKNKYSGFHPIGSFIIQMKGAYDAEELQALLPEIEITRARDLYEGFQYQLFINATTVKETVEAIAAIKENTNVASLNWAYPGKLLPGFAPKKLDEGSYKPSERSDVTVATALNALRIAADLTEVKNGVYDYRLADAIWQYDCDGDKEITVSDALQLLRKAAKLA